MQRTMDTAGGYAALVCAWTYVVGFIGATSLRSNPPSGTLEQIAYLLERQMALELWYLVIYVIFGAALLVLTLALHNQVEERSRDLGRIATAFGLVWAGLVFASGMIAKIALQTVGRIHAVDPNQAHTIWLAMNTVREGLGGGVEVVGGLWVFLISVAAWRSQAAPSWLNSLGLGIGTAGILTALKTTDALGAVFGIGQILWFVGIGRALIINQTWRRIEPTKPQNTARPQRSSRII